jgi:hypothetical protein
VKEQVSYLRKVAARGSRELGGNVKLGLRLTQRWLRKVISSGI